MAEQQDLQAYVRQRMAGTEQPPAPPDPNPMASYVVAQGARGLTVPPRTRMDSPQYLELPDAPGEQDQKVAPTTNAADQARTDQQTDLLDQLGAVENGYKTMPPGPARDAVFKRLMALSNQLSALNAQPPGAMVGSRRRVDMANASGQDVATIEAAMRQRQSQPRRKLPSPAPGGVPGSGEPP